MDNSTVSSYSKELFVSSTQGLECGICGNVMNNPQQCKNGHLFCLSCLQSQLKLGNNKCLSCGIGVNLYEIGNCLFAKNMINCLTVRCKCTLNNTSTGSHCQWTGTLLDLETRSCAFIPEVCSNQGCDGKFLGGQREAHAAECSYRVVECDHCQAKMTHQQLEKHCKRCSKRPVSCECGELVPHNSLEEHIALSCPITDVECPIAAIHCCSNSCPGGMTRRDLMTHIAEVTSTPDCMLKLVLSIDQLRDRERDRDVEQQANGNYKKKRPRIGVKKELPPLQLRVIPSVQQQDSVVHVSSPGDDERDSMRDEFSTSSQRVCSPIRDLMPAHRHRTGGSPHEVELSVLNDLFSNSDNEAPDDASIDTAMEVETAPEPLVACATAAPSSHIEASVSSTASPHQSGAKESVFEYKGEFNKEGKRHGHGLMTWLSGSRAGDVYKGQFSNGLRRGVGVMSSSNGDTYTGQWLKDARQGQGVMQYANKERYEGEWKHGMRHGEGKYTYVNGDTYSGTWSQDCMHGQGRYTWVKSKDEYEGMWVRNEKNGEGEYRYTNGDVYSGQFKDDRLDGEGILRYANGNIFEGTWRNGYQHGKGVMKVKGGRGRGKGLTTETQEWMWGKKV